MSRKKVRKSRRKIRKSRKKVRKSRRKIRKSRRKVRKSRKKVRKSRRKVRKSRRKVRKLKYRLGVSKDGFFVKIIKEKTTFYKSVKFAGDVIMIYHKILKKDLPTSSRKCLRGTSMWLTPDSKRAKQYCGPYCVLNSFKVINNITLFYPQQNSRNQIKELINNSNIQFLRNTQMGELIEELGEDTYTLEESCLNLFCIAFGIETSVEDQFNFLQNLFSLANHFDLTDKNKYGQAATPQLKSPNNSLLDFIEYFSNFYRDLPKKEEKRKNQRLSYFGFDLIILQIICNSKFGFPGYYFDCKNQVWPDSGSEMALFQANEYLESVSTGMGPR